MVRKQIRTLTLAEASEKELLAELAQPLRCSIHRPQARISPTRTSPTV
jgi:hypothetical protein